VSAINKKMLEAGKGAYEDVHVSADGLESFSAKCGDVYFVYLLNSGNADVKTNATLSINSNALNSFQIQEFDPATNQYSDGSSVTPKSNSLVIEGISLTRQQDRILILSPRRKSSSN